MQFLGWILVILLILAIVAVVWAMVRGVEPATLRRVLLLLGIVACVVGLKVVA